MTRRNNKISRNAPCPCASGKKYKHCCWGKVDWNNVISQGLDWKPLLSIRGKNILFIERMLEALQFDQPLKQKSLSEYKAAFTPKAVKEIHEAIVDIWPPDCDIFETLSSSKSEATGLFVGDYEKSNITRSITRHSLYANKVLLVDPFVYPLSVRDHFSPILNPEKFRTQTLKNVDLWFSMLPWITAGIVEFIRTPSDFDSKLNWESMKRQEKKFSENIELNKTLEDSIEEKVDRYKEEEGERMLLLSSPDSYLRKSYRELWPDHPKSKEDEFIEHIHERRRNDPFYLGPLPETPNEYDEFHIKSSGASYEIARLTASVTDSYLVTDLPSKWKEIEIDRDNDHGAANEWEPLARAFQNVELKYLDAVNLDHALILRNENRLASLRTFLRKTWRAACSGNPYGSQNVQFLTEELESEVAYAEEEWRQIDRDLLKWFGGESAASLLAAGPLIASGHAGFLGAAFAVAGASNLISSTLRRKGFKEKLPAAFFMDLKRGCSK